MSYFCVYFFRFRALQTFLYGRVEPSTGRLTGQLRLPLVGEAAATKAQFQCSFPLVLAGSSPHCTALHCTALHLSPPLTTVHPNVDSVSILATCFACYWME